MKINLALPEEKSEDISKTEKEKLKVITINTEQNDDWMKTLPGYKDEISIIESVRNQS